MAATDDTEKLIEYHSEEGVTSAAGCPVYPGYPPQKTYVTPEAPPTYKQSVDTAQPTAVGFITQPSGLFFPIQTAPQTSGMIRQAPSQPVRDYTIFAVIVTLFFCVPFGIVGIVKASEAKRKQNSGDEEGARQTAQSAFVWSVSGLVSGLVLLLAFIIFKYLAVSQ